MQWHRKSNAKTMQLQGLSKNDAMGAQGHSKHNAIKKQRQRKINAMATFDGDEKNDATGVPGRRNFDIKGNTIRTQGL